ncbi:MAG: hypothetical protein Q8M26_04755 [Pseudolabrys sp.]|nr:hypothetical protein [Pseudolabrys sp.]
MDIFKFGLPVPVYHGSFCGGCRTQSAAARIVRMFRWLISQRRRRAASLLVALYALCLITPTAVLALDSLPAAAHCLTEKNHGQSDHHANHDTGESHHGSAGSSHHSNSGDDEKNQTGKCCGLFCISAIATSVDVFGWRHPPTTHVPSLFVESLSGQDTDRIDRPPRSLLSL